MIEDKLDALGYTVAEGIGPEYHYLLLVFERPQVDGENVEAMVRSDMSEAEGAGCLIQLADKMRAQLN